MKYAVEMGPGAMIYVPNFIKIGPAIQKLIGGVHRHTDSDRICLLLFFPNKETKKPKIIKLK
jgi:hypothetical protein